MTHDPIPCLILACGNPLREDDGAGPWLARKVAGQFPTDARLRILAPQQWSPELAEEVAHAQAVLFVDCEANGTPGAIRLTPVEPATEIPRMMSHHLSAPDLLALSRNYYGSLPGTALLLSVGAGSLEMRESFSAAMKAALPDAENVLVGTILRLLNAPPPAAAHHPPSSAVENGNGRHPEGAAADSAPASSSASS